jgi:hypothetical protein
VRRVRSSWGGVGCRYGGWWRGGGRAPCSRLVGWGVGSLWPLVEGGGRAPCSQFVGWGVVVAVGGGGWSCAVFAVRGVWWPLVAVGGWRWLWILVAGGTLVPTTSYHKL